MEKAPEANINIMLLSNLLNFTENLSSRKFSDAEILGDVEAIHSVLQTKYQSLS